MSYFFKVFADSVQAFFKSPEIALRDRIAIAIILLLILSPVDFIPESIPIIGLLDDLFLLALLYDFSFKTLPRDLALKLYAGNEHDYQRLERGFSFLGWLRPATLLRPLWRTPSLYRRH